MEVQLFCDCSGLIFFFFCHILKHQFNDFKKKSHQVSLHLAFWFSLCVSSDSMNQWKARLSQRINPAKIITNGCWGSAELGLRSAAFLHWLCRPPPSEPRLMIPAELSFLLALECMTYKFRNRLSDV